MSCRAGAVLFPCGRCGMLYGEYEQLVAHLYWRHGTDSEPCGACGLRRWRFAAHRCSVLPTGGRLGASYCLCGEQDDDAPMIGCDSPECTRQWFHFKCVGIVTPPKGDWFCPDCRKKYAAHVIK